MPDGSESNGAPTAAPLTPPRSDSAPTADDTTGSCTTGTGLSLRRLFDPVDLLPLVCFRIFFGAMMLYYVVAKLRDHWVDYFYIRPDFHLTYWGFSWVQPWPGQGMYYHFGVMGLAAVGILTGMFYRFSAAVFAVCFTYVFLLEKALYQNHYYLICLLSGIMVFVPAQRMCSVDAYWHPQIRTQTAPQVWLWLLRIQVAIPYVYGGIAKINSDWLHGMPMRLWLERRADFPLVGPWLNTDGAAILLAWGGLLLDLLVVPALMWRRTRICAYAVAVMFHLANSVLWNIGIFPWFMIGATLVFFPVDSFRKVLRRRPGASADWEQSQQPIESAASFSPAGEMVAEGRMRGGPRASSPLIRGEGQQPAETSDSPGESMRSQRSGPDQHSAPQDRWTRRERIIAGAVGLYVGWQLLFPFRHFLYPGNPSWTEEAHHFSWHMLLREKNVGIRFFVHHKASGKRGVLKISEFLNERQLSRMAKDPDMILNFVHYIRDHYREHGQGDVEIRVLALASLNGRKPQLLMDPTIDYAAVDRVWGTQPWIVPLYEPLRKDGWDVPLDQWDAELADLIPDNMKLVGVR